MWKPSQATIEAAIMVGLCFWMFLVSYSIGKAWSNAQANKPRIEKITK